MGRSEEVEKAIRSLNYFKAAIDENIAKNKIGIEITGLESLSEDFKKVFKYISELEEKTIKKEDLIKVVDFGVEATNASDDYSIGMCNGMIYIKSVVTQTEPKYKECKHIEQKIRDKIKFLENRAKEYGYYKTEIEYARNTLQEIIGE